MTLQTDIETAAAQVLADSQKLKDIVNGDAATVVNVDSGPVKSAAKAIAEIGDTSNQAVKDLSNVLDADFSAKAASAGIGTGDMAAANNLSDVTDAAAARTNIGLATAAVENVAAGGSGGLLRSDGEGSGLTGTLLKSLPPAVKTTDYTVVAADAGKMLIMNSATAKTFTLPAFTAITNGFVVGFRNIGAGVCTLDGDGAEQINGATTLDLAQDEEILLYADTANSQWRGAVIGVSGGGGGAMVLIDSTNITSSTASVAFTGLDTVTYNMFRVVITELIPVTDNSNLEMQIGTGAGPAWQTSNYAGSGCYHTQTHPLATVQYADGKTEMKLTTTYNGGDDPPYGMGNNTMESGHVLVDISDLATNKHPIVRAEGAFNGGDNPNGDPTLCFGMHTWQGATAVTAIKFFFNNGNIGHGRFTLYGIAHA